MGRSRIGFNSTAVVRKLFLKEPNSKYCGLASPNVSVANTELCHCRLKATRQYVNDGRGYVLTNFTDTVCQSLLYLMFFPVFHQLPGVSIMSLKSVWARAPISPSCTTSSISVPFPTLRHPSGLSYSWTPNPLPRIHKGPTHKHLSAPPTHLPLLQGPALKMLDILAVPNSELRTVRPQCSAWTPAQEIVFR